MFKILFRDFLTRAGIIRQLFERFKDAHLITGNGTIADAAFVDAPRQRNTPEENKIIRKGGIPEEWKTDENSHKPAQKDTDLRGHKRQCSRQSGTDGPDR